MINFSALLRRLASVALLCAAVAGCGREPQIAKANIKLVDKLRTAVAAKRDDWLQAAVKQIDKGHSAGKLTDDEYAALTPIVANARQGHWNEANEKIAQLIHSQR